MKLRPAVNRTAAPIDTESWISAGASELGNRWRKMILMSELPTQRAASMYSISRSDSASLRISRTNTGMLKSIST